MYFSPSKEEIQNNSKIKEIYDDEVANFGKENVDKDFCVLKCDKCGEYFNVDFGWSLENNTNCTGDEMYDLCENCGKEIILNNIKKYKNTQVK